jgi:hypothetical protein
VSNVLDDLLIVTSEPNSPQNDGVWGVEKQTRGTWIGLRDARTVVDRQTCAVEYLILNGYTNYKNNGAPGMNRILFSVAIVSLAAFIASPNAAQQDVFIYPQKGQSQEQQSKDRNECHTWAVQQTGFDPNAPVAASQSSTQGAAGGEVVRGGARGAALGAVGGAIAGNAGKGAAIGAVVGGGGGLLRRGQAERQAAEQKAQQTAITEEQRTSYKRAVSACLEARGYTVK